MKTSWDELIEALETKGKESQELQTQLQAQVAELEELQQRCQSLASHAVMDEAELLRKEERLAVAEALLEKSRIVIDDMRLTDRYNSRAPFDVNDHLTDIESFLSSQSGEWVAVRREDLPDPEKLRILARWIDKRFPHDPGPEVQTTLREWANKIQIALESAN